MAVRRRIQQLLQEPQVAGAITLERPGSLQSGDRRRLPPPESPGAGTLLRRRLRLEECALFHCRECRTVLGDSLHLCAQEDRCLRVLVCFRALECVRLKIGCSRAFQHPVTPVSKKPDKISILKRLLDGEHEEVTNDVDLEDSLMVGIEGALLGCAYYALYCRSCGLMVGFSLYSSFTALAHLRGLFCLFKDSILCYLLKTKAIIAASEMNFPAWSIKEHLGKLKEQLVVVHVRLELLIKRLEELNQQNNVADKQSYASRIVGLKPGFARIKSSN